MNLHIAIWTEVITVLNDILFNVSKRHFYPNGLTSISHSFSKEISKSKTVNENLIDHHKCSIKFSMDGFDANQALSSVWKALLKHNLDKQRYIKEKVYVA